MHECDDRDGDDDNASHLVPDERDRLDVLVLEHLLKEGLAAFTAPCVDDDSAHKSLFRLFLLFRQHLAQIVIHLLMST